MTPKTRSSNQDADYKVYYSRKVPQQVRFPHKRKTVRRRSTPVHDGKRQMVFLPDKMRRQGTPVVADSDEDSDTDIEEDLEDGGVSVKVEVDEEEEEQPVRQTKRKGKKRNSDGVQQEDDGEEQTSAPTSKRRRTAATPKNPRRSRRVEAESDDDDDATATKPNRERTLRRQSTMTQLVDGRKPLPDDEEPSFKPVKQSSRLSWGGRGKSDAKSDRKQRTLTQMIPGMRPQEIMSDEDLDEILSDVEAEDRASQTYGDAVAQRLAQQGFYRVEGNGVREDNGADEAGNDMEQSPEDEHVKKEPTANSQDTPELVVQSVEDEMDEDCEDSYKPTQFIEAPVTRTTRATRRGNRPRVADTEEAFYAPQGQARTRKARFSLLSTPEKRRIREIPSSQSPADSPLSTQVSPQKLYRSPLKQRLDNPILAPETPSKRKQVTFKMPSKTPIPPPTLRKFESTIQDSEDEDDGVIEEDLPTIGRHGGGDAPASASRGTATEKSVGADTQAVLDRIDQACADANGEEVMEDTALSQASGDLPRLRSDQEPSPELGDPQKQSSGRSSSTVAESVAIKQEPGYDDDDYEDEEDDDATILPTVPFNPSNEERQIKNETNTSSEGELPLPEEQLRSTPPVIEDLNQETCPSTPMVINDDSSEEEDEPAPDPTSPRSSKAHVPQSTSTDTHQSADLDSESIQVPRSPSPDHETQQSHSSKAEQQLHNEWFSYSQYINARPPDSSSMRAAPDAFSYNDTPRLPQPTAPHSNSNHQPSGYHPSQATTVDEITQRTPRRKRTQHFSSTHTTPHRIASSQPNISPGKPPPLFIPSSFPSPEKVAAEGEGWSSPMFGLTQATHAVGGWRSSQWASLEDFSIPAPPPGMDGDGDGDDG
ncbi:uncharacterized protein J4E88_003554 [Alternaria novae-zelandiae]|uniref:uncharacterized protein n=1 Tax=Alternaria novae-zelandiae TaxID=430562 RepID=UPI0020C47678|nr:uncharacterized protein J4E88_003554 [Alternaria novae-zelandiae]KAI4685719.1 hypothetical protein J4E88_003554 [Alternaria novae-zelandiae]